MSLQEKSYKDQSVPPLATLSFGALSGLASCVLLQPFDLLKTRLQQLDAADHHQTSGSSASNPYRKGLWRGTAPTIVRNVPGVALYFYSVSHLRSWASSRQIPYLSSQASSTLAKLSTTGNLITGAVARVTVGLILSPVTVVKARFEVSPPFYSSPSPPPPPPPPRGRTSHSPETRPAISYTSFPAYRLPSKRSNLALSKRVAHTVQCVLCCTYRPLSRLFLKD
ncbi:mitochondrial carrier [Violaceomyces palustris]|uniref:Mitochondrial carrier n=1 Tax=Violaceomyces palustris TaxID=1673888 RepID=A0ACD0NNM7_9BASI|nr:mitochondrial carrier [Violaceomyces palustris]